MFDDYSAGLPLTVVVILENLSVAWIYGSKRYLVPVSTSRSVGSCYRT